MIVKITYSTDVKNVPQEVFKLLSSLKKEAADLSNSIGESSKEIKSSSEDVRGSIIKIESAIEECERLLSRLKDSHAIVHGYRNLLEQEKANKSPQEDNTKPKVTKNKSTSTK
jgi:small-conductance mechanosensitive channel